MVLAEEGKKDSRKMNVPADVKVKSPFDPSQSPCSGCTKTSIGNRKVRDYRYPTITVDRTDDSPSKRTIKVLWGQRPSSEANYGYISGTSAERGSGISTSR